MVQRHPIFSRGNVASAARSARRVNHLEIAPPADGLLKLSGDRLGKLLAQAVRQRPGQGFPGIRGDEPAHFRAPFGGEPFALREKRGLPGCGSAGVFVRPRVESREGIQPVRRLRPIGPIRLTCQRSARGRRCPRLRLRPGGRPQLRRRAAGVAGSPVLTVPKPQAQAQTHHTRQAHACQQFK